MMWRGRKVRRGKGGKEFLLLRTITSVLLPLNVLTVCVCVCVCVFVWSVWEHRATLIRPVTPSDRQRYGFSLIFSAGVCSLLFFSLAVSRRHNKLISFRSCSSRPVHHSETLAFHTFLQTADASEYVCVTCVQYVWRGRWWLDKAARSVTTVRHLERS